MSERAMKSWRHLLVWLCKLLAKDVHNLGCAVESFDSADLLHRARQNRHNKTITPLILSLNES